jgi:hypothetical protein
MDRIDVKLFYYIVNIIQEHVPQVHAIYCILFYY